APWPMQREDVVEAIAFIRARAIQLGVDPRRFVLVRRSAGAQLAQAMAYGANDPGIRGIVSIYGLSDLAAAWTASTDRELMNGWTKRELIERLLGGTP